MTDQYQIADQLRAETGLQVYYSFHAGFHVSRGVLVATGIQPTAEAVRAAWDNMGESWFNQPDTSTGSTGESWWDEKG